MNHDGRADVLIGASGYLAGTGTGYADIYSGRTYGLIRRLTGDASGDQFGSGAGWTRDVNRDGVADQIVGARNAGPGGRGRVYVYSGKSGARLFTIDAGPNGNSFGSFFVAGVGDVNRDGTPDIYAADYADTTNGGDLLTTQSGRAAVYSGRDGRELSLVQKAPTTASGAGPWRRGREPRWARDRSSAHCSSNNKRFNAGRVQIFSGKDGSVLRTITARRRRAVRVRRGRIGDVNRDGIPDALVAAATGDHVYVIAGARERLRSLKPLLRRRRPCGSRSGRAANHARTASKRM